MPPRDFDFKLLLMDIKIRAFIRFCHTTEWTNRKIDEYNDQLDLMGRILWSRAAQIVLDLLLLTILRKFTSETITLASHRLSSKRPKLTSNWLLMSVSHFPSPDSFAIAGALCLKVHHSCSKSMSDREINVMLPLLKFSNALWTDLPTRLTIFRSEIPKMSCTALEMAFAVIFVVFKDAFSFSLLAWATMSSVDVMMRSLTS